MWNWAHCRQVIPSLEACVRWEWQETGTCWVHQCRSRLLESEHWGKHKLSLFFSVHFVCKQPNSREIIWCNSLSVTCMVSFLWDEWFLSAVRQSGITASLGHCANLWERRFVRCSWGITYQIMIFGSKQVKLPDDKFLHCVGALWNQRFHHGVRDTSHRELVFS